jgi:hypothetical protein
MGLDAAGFPDRVRAIGTNRPAIVTALGRFVRGTRSYLVVTTGFGHRRGTQRRRLVDHGRAAGPVVGAGCVRHNYIANIGFIIGLVPPALLALLRCGPKLAALVVLVTGRCCACSSVAGCAGVSCSPAPSSRESDRRGAFAVVTLTVLGVLLVIGPCWAPSLRAGSPRNHGLHEDQLLAAATGGDHAFLRWSASGWSSAS